MATREWFVLLECLDHREDLFGTLTRVGGEPIDLHLFDLGRKLLGRSRSQRCAVAGRGLVGKHKCEFEQRCKRKEASSHAFDDGRCGDRGDNEGQEEQHRLSKALRCWEQWSNDPGCEQRSDERNEEHGNANSARDTRSCQPGRLSWFCCSARRAFHHRKHRTFLGVPLASVTTCDVLIYPLN